MTGIFHACLEFMNRKIGLIPFLTGVFVNKHVKTLLFDKIEELVSVPWLPGGGSRNHNCVNKKAGPRS